MPALVRDKENDGDGGNSGFPKNCSPELGWLFHSAIDSTGKKGIFSLRVSFLYMAENTTVVCTHFWTVKGKQKDGL